MFFEMIRKRRDLWLATPGCPVLPTLKAMESAALSGCGLREVQIDAIKTYLFLKVGCENLPLAKLFSDGVFTTIDIDRIRLTATASAYLKQHPASVALLEFATQKEEGAKDVLSPELAQILTTDPEKIKAEELFERIFYGVTYADYLFSLPMGAGKTFLMAAFIYLDLMYAQQDPTNPAFAHNFIVIAPSGTKSSIVPSLKTIESFDPSWVIPEPLASNLRRLVHFEVLDSEKSANRSNLARDPNVRKIARFQPYDTMFGVVMVTNAEKLIVDRLSKSEQAMLLRRSEEERQDYLNELRNTIGKIPHLAIMIDEAHHAPSQKDTDDETLLRSKVISKWASSDNGINCVLGFSGTPYLDKAERVELGAGLSYKTTEISSTVHYYPLVRGVGDFLKRPKVTIVNGSVTPLAIVRRGVKDFFDTHGETAYANGCRAKLAIYCGGVDRLEEEIYPDVATTIKSMGMDPAEVILKYHRGNKKYPEPKDAQLDFEQLDQPYSKKRIVLLVQIGKEGWDCRSLAGVVLSQEGDCPKKMVLQTSCRCLREMDDAENEAAVIFLNGSNGKHLAEQLQQQQHATLADFQSGLRTQHKIRRYDRSGVLDLPKLPFYQLVVHHVEKIIDDKTPPHKRLSELKNTLADYRQKETFSVGDFKRLRQTVSTVHGEYADIGFATTFPAWLRLISKESFNKLSIQDLESEESTLKNIFDAITVADADGDRVLSSGYRQSDIRSAIRLAFWPHYKLETSEEDVPEDAELLNVQYLAGHSEIDVSDTTPFVPDQRECKDIIQKDGQPKWSESEAIAKLERKIAEADGDEEIAAIFKRRLEQLKGGEAAVSSADYSYHYLPYRTDSKFERTFLAEALARAEIRNRGLEVYYNGDAPFTRFQIKCYRKSAANRWDYVGMYTPDFLILERDKNRKKIAKCLIVETKGELYANDPRFQQRRAFMEQVFKSRQQNFPDLPAFEYLYLEEDDGDQWQETFIDKINAFFQGVSNV